MNILFNIDPYELNYFYEDEHSMRILFIGDIVGKVGRNAIAEYLPKIKQSYRPTVV